MRRIRYLSFFAFLLLLIFTGFSYCITNNHQVEANASNIKLGELPEGFVVVTDVVPDAILEMRYYSTYNFVGERIDGYNSPIAILSIEAANALKKASDLLKSQGYVIKIFDAYRPQSAVDHFVRWGKDSSDQKTKEAFYPDIDKCDAFNLGYVPTGKSMHTRGSAVDLTILEIKTGKEVDMGAPFDFFGDISHHDTKFINLQQTANRKILKDAMEQSGFKSYHEEWWHYTLKNEPYPNTYFNFPVNDYKIIKPELPNSDLRK